MFEKTFDVPYYGLGTDGKIKPETLLEFFQEAAALHADSIGIGVANLMERHMTWVLRRYRVNVKKRPGRRPIEIRTWFEPRRNLMSVRVFEARSNGETIAGAWSAWIVVDLNRGRPVRLDHALPDAYFAAVEPTGEPVTEELRAVGDDFDHERAFSVRRRELDLNGHANHTAYFDWATESIPDDAITGLSPVRFDAEFLASATRDDVTVRSKKRSDDPITFDHAITASSGVLFAKLATTWVRQKI
jgi:acyl-ACP thioesterase